jgi:hypothetical protein
MVIGAILNFLTERLWWWLGPAVSIVVFLAGVVMYSREAVIAVTPFIYTLF